MSTNKTSSLVCSAVARDFIAGVEVFPAWNVYAGISTVRSFLSCQLGLPQSRWCFYRESNAGDIWLWIIPIFSLLVGTKVSDISGIKPSSFLRWCCYYRNSKTWFNTEYLTTDGLNTGWQSCHRTYFCLCARHRLGSILVSKLLH